MANRMDFVLLKLLLVLLAMPPMIVTCEAHQNYHSPDGAFRYKNINRRTPSPKTNETVVEISRAKRSSYKAKDHIQIKPHSHINNEGLHKKKSHLYPYEDKNVYRHTYEETHEHIDEEYKPQGENDDHKGQASRHKEKYLKYSSVEAKGSELSGYDDPHEKVKIKHHHHHHHHNHVKEIIKHVPEPYPVEKIVRVPVEKIVEKIVHVPKPYAVEKKVPYPIEKIVEKIVNIPVEKIVHVPQPYPVEKIVHVPVDKIVEKVVEKIVPKPYAVEKIVEKIIHVPKPYPVEKILRVPVHKVVEKIVQVPKPYAVEKKVPYPVEHLVHVPYEKVVVPKPFPGHVHKMFPHIQQQAFQYENSQKDIHEQQSANTQSYQYGHEKRHESPHYQLYEIHSNVNQQDYARLKVQNDIKNQRYQNVNYKDHVHPSSDLDNRPLESQGNQLQREQKHQEYKSTAQTNPDLQTQASTNAVQYLHFPIQLFHLQPFRPVGFTNKDTTTNST